MSVKLINKRGRVVDVDETNVEKLLSTGWLRAPNDAQEYNPVFDRDTSDTAMPSASLEDLPENNRPDKQVLEVVEV